MRILITGANGLVGQGVLRECLRDPAVTGVVALGRRPSGQVHAKLTELACADFADLSAVEDQLQPFDACFYGAGAPPLAPRKPNTVGSPCISPCMSPPRSQASTGCGVRLHSVRTPTRQPPDARSIKGETEQALAALPIRTVMLRPGGIQPVDGVRSPHAAMAAAHALAGPLLGLGVRMLPGLLTTTERVGRAMLAVLRQQPVPAVVENAEINRLGS